MSIGVEILPQMSHNTLTNAEEYIEMKDIRLKVEIAPLALSDYGFGNQTEA